MKVKVSSVKLALNKARVELLGRPNGEASAEEYAQRILAVTAIEDSLSGLEDFQSTESIELADVLRVLTEDAVRVSKE